MPGVKSVMMPGIAARTKDVTQTTKTATNAYFRLTRDKYLEGV